ncbi:MAG: preprotein translocase subunit SecG, partial [Lachnospiraceae bacterium]|nr:preprotein translocase subunit SecG [Lachnospiraceae bacterium]MCD8097068.1 preprotein translocase subunit SecG [Lachnospiraceae bacterium]
MQILRYVLMAIFVLICIVATVLVLMQEGKSDGLGALAGAAETYWGKNKGRSMEGAIAKWTKILLVLFFVLAIVLNLSVF